MNRFTVFRIREYDEQTIPDNPDDVVLDRPLILEYADDVSKEHIYSDYLKFYKLPDTTDVIITINPESNGHESMSKKMIYNAIGKDITQGKLNALSKVVGHKAIYLINKPEYICEKIIPKNFTITKSTHEVNVWIPIR